MNVILVSFVALNFPSLVITYFFRIQFYKEQSKFHYTHKDLVDAPQYSNLC